MIDVCIIHDDYVEVLEDIPTWLELYLKKFKLKEPMWIRRRTSGVNFQGEFFHIPGLSFDITANRETDRQAVKMFQLAEDNDDIPVCEVWYYDKVWSRETNEEFERKYGDAQSIFWQETMYGTIVTNEFMQMCFEKNLVRVHK